MNVLRTQAVIWSLCDEMKTKGLTVEDSQAFFAEMAMSHKRATDDSLTGLVTPVLRMQPTSAQALQNPGDDCRICNKSE